MANRSITQLKAWFSAGKYPTAAQFSDWLDSFFHKEEKIPVSAIDGLAEQLNKKYNTTEAQILDTRTSEALRQTEMLKGDVKNAFASIAQQENLTEGHTVSIEAARVDLVTIGAMLKEGATPQEAQEAMQELGENYKDLYAIGYTLRAFLGSDVTVDATLEAWRQIDQLLQELTDAKTLTAMLKALEGSLTAAYTAAVALETQRATQVEAQLRADLEAAKVTVVDNLGSTDQNAALSANQGHFLGDQIRNIGAGVMLVDEQAKSGYQSFDRSKNHTLYVPSGIVAMLPLGEVIYPYKASTGEIALDPKRIRRHGSAVVTVEGADQFHLTEAGTYIVLFKIIGTRRTRELIVTEADIASGPKVISVSDYMYMPTTADCGKGLTQYVRIYKKNTSRYQLERGFAYRFDKQAEHYVRITHQKPFLMKNTLADAETGRVFQIVPKLSRYFVTDGNVKVVPEIFAENRAEFYLKGITLIVEVKKAKTANVTIQYFPKRQDMHYTGYSNVKGRTFMDLVKVKSCYRRSDEFIYFDLRLVAVSKNRQIVAEYRATRAANGRYVVRRK